MHFNDFEDNSDLSGPSLLANNQSTQLYPVEEPNLPQTIRSAMKDLLADSTNSQPPINYALEGGEEEEPEAPELESLDEEDSGESEEHGHLGGSSGSDSAQLSDTEWVNASKQTKLLVRTNPL